MHSKQRVRHRCCGALCLVLGDRWLRDPVRLVALLAFMSVGGLGLLGWLLSKHSFARARHTVLGHSHARNHGILDGLVQDPVSQGGHDLPSGAMAGAPTLCPGMDAGIKGRHTRFLEMLHALNGGASDCCALNAALTAI